MNNATVLKKGFITRLVLLILLVFVIFSTISGIFLYYNIYTPLDTNYSASISIISEIKEDLLVRTLTISMVFYLFILTGIVLLAILYTHRIAGPMQRIKLFAREVIGVDLSAALKFRKKDAIHSFGDTLNKMTGSWRNRLLALASHTEQLENAVNKLRSRSKSEEDTAALLGKISSINKEINKLFKEIKQ